MTRIGSLFLAVCFMASAVSAKTVLESYNVSSYSPSGHSLYMNKAKFHFGAGALFQRFDDGTGSLTGTALNGAGKGYDVSLSFVNFRNWDQQKVAGLDAKGKGKGKGDQSTWTFMDLAPVSTLTRIGGAKDGKVYDLLMKPVNGPYTFQYGVGANDKKSGMNGLSGWFFTEGDRTNGTGAPCKKNRTNNGGSTCDFNLKLAAVPPGGIGTVPLPAGIALLPFGLSALLGLRRRRSRKSA